MSQTTGSFSSVLSTHSQPNLEMSGTDNLHAHDLWPNPLPLLIISEFGSMCKSQCSTFSSYMSCRVLYPLACVCIATLVACAGLKTFFGIENKPAVQLHPLHKNVSVVITLYIYVIPFSNRFFSPSDLISLYQHFLICCMPWQYSTWQYHYLVHWTLMLD